MVAPGEPSEYFALLWAGVRSAAAEISSLGLHVESLVTPCHDVARQREILAALLASSPDAIALIPAHASALDDLIERHVEQGASVVTFSADAPDSKRCSYVGADPLRSGALAGEMLAKLAGGGKPIRLGAFPGPLIQGHLAARYRGFLGELAKRQPAPEVAFCCEEVENLPHAAVQFLAAHADIHGIYVGNSRAWEIGGALETLGLRIPCVGFDNTPAVRPYLEKGVVSAVIDQNAYQQGYLAVQRAYETLSSRRRITRSTMIPSSVVFAANASEPTSTDTLNEAFEILVRRRTAKLRSYQRMLTEANHQLTHLAETDSLTGLYNRRKIEYLLEEYMAHTAAHALLSLLMIDVDRFKLYNDLCGHETGDEALRVLSRILAAQIRMPDCCGRLGGDEFCILLPNTPLAGAAALRHRLHEAVAQVVVPAASGDLTMTLSIGVATAPADGITPHELLRSADRDMYREKERLAAVRPGEASRADSPGPIRVN